MSSLPARLNLINGQSVPAAGGLTIAVVDPADTRREIAAALDMLANKRERLPRRKHGNTPL